MVRTETIVESRPTELELTEEQAASLAAIGRRLASKRTWWGDEEVADSDRSVIGCHRLPGGRWTVTVREAVGAVRIGDLQIVIRPKIPPGHFCYLATQSDLLPRVESVETSIAEGDDFVQLIARWFLDSLERLLRNDLARGYTDCADELEMVRGRILPIETTQLLLQGKTRASCEFEDFSEDIALNRVLRAAGEAVAASPLLLAHLRRRARGILSRFGDVGGLKPSDIHVQVDRLTGRYATPLAFAKHLLGVGGIELSHGATSGWSFLIRTPELIEAGIRTSLSKALAPDWPVARGKRTGGRSSVTFNPDLVFGIDGAIGDVKYKIASVDWVRSDLLQGIAFATAFRSKTAMLVGFSGGGTDVPSQVEAGDVLMRFFAWETQLAPTEAHLKLSSSVRDWLNQRRNVSTGTMFVV